MPDSWSGKQPGLAAAEQALHDHHGIVLDSVTGTKNYVAVVGNKLQQKLSVAIQDAAHGRWSASATTCERVVAASAANSPESPGASDWLMAKPSCKKCAFPDNAYRALLMWRLHLPLAPAGSNCAYLIRSHNATCSSPLTPEVDHAFHCCRSQIVGRDDALRDVWASFYAQAGAGVLTEQRGVGVPQQSERTCARRNVCWSHIGGET